MRTKVLEETTMAGSGNDCTEKERKLTGWNSFCRKTTLTKHQHRSHPPDNMTRPPSEDTISERSYQTPVAVTVADDQYLLAQQPYYPQSATPSHEFYPPQSLPVTQMVPEPQPLVTQNVPVSPSLDIQQMQQVQHQYLQMMQQQQQHQHQHPHHQPRQNRPNFMPPEFSQPHFTGNHMVESQQIMMSYLPNYEFKPPTRILNQPEGTDWGFLGVG